MVSEHEVMAGVANACNQETGNLESVREISES